MKFLSKTVIKFLRIGCMVGLAFLSFGIWIPQLQAITYQATLGDNWFSWVFSLYGNKSPMSVSSATGILFELWIVLSGMSVSISLIIKAALLIFISNKRAKKKKYILLFVSIGAIILITIFQMATKINSGNIIIPTDPIESLSAASNIIDDGINKEYFNSIDVFTISFWISVTTTVIFIVYLLISKYIFAGIVDRFDERDGKKKEKKAKKEKDDK